MPTIFFFIIDIINFLLRDRRSLRKTHFIFKYTVIQKLKMPTLIFKLFI
jgi:hypothetical protein